jgi:hypothetical protein
VAGLAGDGKLQAARINVKLMRSVS